MKNKRNVYDSLRAFIEEEVLDGDNKYQCDKCNAKVAAIKRTCISALPNTLILHLKRIEFDLELFERTKINDTYEFPHELDMMEYMLESQKEGGAKAAAELQSNPRSREYYQYRLSGVLCHRYDFGFSFFFSPFYTSISNTDAISCDCSHTVYIL